MPFHNITELPKGFCDPDTVFDEELSIGDRLQITELLHRVYLCEDSRNYHALKKILVEDEMNEQKMDGKTAYAFDRDRISIHK